MKKQYFLILYLISCIFVSCEDEVITRTITKEVEVEVPVDVPVEVPVDVPITGKAIATAAELAKIGVDPEYSLTGDYYLTADINLAGYDEWVPIGSDTAPFTGVFNGTEHTIKNLKLGGAYRNIGLFAYTNFAKIKKLNIEIINTLDDKISGTIQYLGVLAGDVRCSEFENINIKSGDTITNAGLFIRSENLTKPYIGGIAGALSYSSVRNSKCELAIKIIGASTSANSTIYAGEIAGSGSASEITNCNAAGSIEVQGMSYCIGGIIGSLGNGNNKNKLENCISSLTKITGSKDRGTQSPSLFVGGVIGQIFIGEVKKCSFILDDLKEALIKNEWAMAASDNKSIYAGGILGRANDTTPLIEDCHIKGNVTIKAYDNGGNFIFAAAIAGALHNKLSRCSADKSVKVFVERIEYTNADTALKTYAGGLVGTSILANSAQPVIEDCFSLASIELQNEAHITNSSARTAAGGLFGGGSITMKRSYYGGDITIVNFASDTVITGGGISGGNPDLTEAIMSTLALGNTVNVITANSVYNFHRIGGDITKANLFANYAKDEMKVTVNGTDLNPVDNGGKGHNQPNGDDISRIDNGAGLSQYFLEHDIGGGDEDYVWDFTNVWKWDDASGLPVLR